MNNNKLINNKQKKVRLSKNNLFKTKLNINFLFNSWMIYTLWKLKKLLIDHMISCYYWNSQIYY